jgi:arylsulfatase A-like enzyme
MAAPFEPTTEWNKKRSLKRVLAPLLGGVGLVAGLVAVVTVQNNPEVEVTKEVNEFDVVTRQTTSVPVSPHVVFFLVDDLGYNDIGYQSVDLTKATPNMDKLAEEGIKLTNYYTEFECTPSRAALMTGRLPVSTGMQHECITTGSEWGLKKSETTMADILQSNGYKTHIIGKWDLGHYAKVLWPTERGFDTFFGLTCYGYTDYSTHANKGGYWDLQDWSNIDGKYNPDKNHYGIYSTYLFGDRAESIVLNHPLDSSLFLYVPFNAVHNDLSVPTDWETTNAAEYELVTEGITSASRQVFAGALYLMDQEVGKIVTALKTSNLYEKSIIIMASDNGGSPTDGGNNWPLRGAKKTMFEGGHHVPAFIHSNLIAKNMYGTKFTGLFHVSDWLPTLITATGTEVSDDISAKFDGYDLWETMVNKEIAEEEKMIRSEVLLNIDYMHDETSSTDSSTSTTSGSESVVSNIDDVWMGLILTLDDGNKYKLMIAQDDYTYYLPNSNGPFGDDSFHKKSNYLFDITNDPYETINLLQHINDNTIIKSRRYDMISIVHQLTSRLCVLYNHKMTSVRFQDKSTSSSISSKAVIEGMHNNWMTFWTTYNDDIDSNFDISKAPQCDSKTLAGLILESATSGVGNDNDDQDVSDEAIAKATDPDVTIDPNTGKPYFSPKAEPAPAPEAPEVVATQSQAPAIKAPATKAPDVVVSSSSSSSSDLSAEEMKQNLLLQTKLDKMSKLKAKALRDKVRDAH